MSVPAESDDLHVGQDANGTTWLVVRYADDWAKTTQSGLYFDPLAQVVELGALEPPTDNDGPLCVPPGGGGPTPADRSKIWLPLSPITDENGDLYVSDRRNNQVLRQRACETSFTPIPGFGGLGFETGRLDNPIGLAIDGRGFLFVADACNHRVQIVRPEDGSVVMVLGAVDSYGRPVAGITGGAMTEPVDVAVDPCHCALYVADRSGQRIHVFNRRFEWVLSFEPQPAGPRPPGEHALPVGIVVEADGTLLIADAHWPRLLHASPNGDVLAEVVLRGAINPHFADLMLSQRFDLDGTALIGPLDSLVYDTAWHEAVVEADLPPGTAVEVQTFASNDPTIAPSTIPWAPALPVRITDGEQPELDGYHRLILSDTERWERSTHGPYLRARPTLATFTGDGPNLGANHVTLPIAALPSVRVGDTLRFTAGTTVVSPKITVLPSPTVTLFLEEAGALFAAGTRVMLRERNGEPLPGAARLIYTFTGADVADLSATPTDGTSADVAFPHGAAAFFRSGDVVDLTAGLTTCTVVIDDVTFTDGVATFAPAAIADLRTSVLALDVTPGRLIAADLKGFESPPPLAEPIHVVDSTGANTATTTVILAEPDTLAVWVDPGPLAGTVTFANWGQFSTDPAIATDRGQYLWVLLRLIGRTDHPAAPVAVDTPAVRSLRLLFQRPSYLAFLPATYSRRDPLQDPTGAIFLERFLTLFEGRLTRIETRYESFSRLLNPEAAPLEWLNWLASWLDLVFDPSWDVDKRRQLVLRAVDLYRRRGTPSSIADWVEIYSGVRPTVVEGFQMGGGGFGTVLDRTSVLGCSVLRDECDTSGPCDATAANALAHRFALYLYLDDACKNEVVVPVVRSIVDVMKPAHTSYDLQLVYPDARIGVQSTVGFDFVLGDDPRPAPSIVGQGIPPSTGGRFRPLLGIDLFLEEDPSRRTIAAAEMASGGVRIDDSLQLK